MWLPIFEWPVVPSHPPALSRAPSPCASLSDYSHGHLPSARRGERTRGLSSPALPLSRCVSPGPATPHPRRPPPTTRALTRSPLELKPTRRSVHKLQRYCLSCGTPKYPSVAGGERHARPSTAHSATLSQHGSERGGGRRGGGGREAPQATSRGRKEAQRSERRERTPRARANVFVTEPSLASRRCRCWPRSQCLVPARGGHA